MSESLHIVCPHCQTTNRVRADQLASAPDCGQCKQPLFTGKPVDLAEAAFDKHLQRNQIPVLVDFWAPLCGPRVARWRPARCRRQPSWSPACKL